MSWREDEDAMPVAASLAIDALAFWAQPIRAQADGPARAGPVPISPRADELIEKCTEKEVSACQELAHLYWDGKITG